MANLSSLKLPYSRFCRYLPHGSGRAAIVFIPVLTFILDLNHFFEFTTVETFVHENENATNTSSVSTVPTNLRFSLQYIISIINKYGDNTYSCLNIT